MKWKGKRQSKNVIDLRKPKARAFPRKPPKKK